MYLAGLLLVVAVAVAAAAPLLRGSDPAASVGGVNPERYLDAWAAGVTLPTEGTPS